MDNHKTFQTQFKQFKQSFLQKTAYSLSHQSSIDSIGIRNNSSFGESIKFNGMNKFGRNLDEAELDAIDIGSNQSDMMYRADAYKYDKKEIQENTNLKPTNSSPNILQESDQTGVFEDLEENNTTNDHTNIQTYSNTNEVNSKPNTGESLTKYDEFQNISEFNKKLLNSNEKSADSFYETHDEKILFEPKDIDQNQENLDFEDYHCHRDQFDLDYININNNIPYENDGEDYKKYQKDNSDEQELNTSFEDINKDNNIEDQKINPNTIQPSKINNKNRENSKIKIDKKLFEEEGKDPSTHISPPNSPKKIIIRKNKDNIDINKVPDNAINDKLGKRELSQIESGSFSPDNPHPIVKEPKRDLKTL